MSRVLSCMTPTQQLVWLQGSDHRHHDPFHAVGEDAKQAGHAIGQGAKNLTQIGGMKAMAKS